MGLDFVAWCLFTENLGLRHGYIGLECMVFRCEVLGGLGLRFYWIAIREFLFFSFFLEIMVWVSGLGHGSMGWVNEKGILIITVVTLQRHNKTIIPNCLVIC